VQHPVLCYGSMRSAGIAAVAALAAAAAAQQAQNPSPMVEHTREHGRLGGEPPAGRRESLDPGTLFLPATIKLRNGVPVLFFFHGGDRVPEIAAARNDMALVAVQIGAGSGTYARAFQNPGRFPALLAAAEGKTGVTFGRVVLGGWSAGCGAIREILKAPEAYRRTAAVLLIDGMHAGYSTGKPGPLESDLETAPLDIWLTLARDAVRGLKRMVVTHSEIFPGTFASTTETADWLLRQLNLKRGPVLKWGPMGTQQIGEARAGRFLLIEYAGNSAPDHVDQLHSLPAYLKWLK